MMTVTQTRSPSSLSSILPSSSLLLLTQPTTLKNSTYLWPGIDELDSFYGHRQSHRGNLLQLGCRQLKRKFKEDATTVVWAASLEAPISLKFYRRSSEAVVIVLGARGIVPVVCSIVLSKVASHSCEALTELLPDSRSQQTKEIFWRRADPTAKFSEFSPVFERYFLIGWQRSKQWQDFKRNAFFANLYDNKYRLKYWYQVTLILRQASMVDSSPVIVLTACDPRYWKTNNNALRLLATGTDFLKTDWSFISSTLRVNPLVNNQLMWL